MRNRLLAGVICRRGQGVPNVCQWQPIPHGGFQKPHSEGPEVAEAYATPEWQTLTLSRHSGAALCRHNVWGAWP